MTVLEVLQSTTAYFKKRDVESARLNAEHLLAHSLGKRRIELYLEFERPLGEAELAPLRELVRRRGQGEPLQHLLGTVEFCGRTFVCDKRALIPRPETEELVEHLLKLEWPANSRMLDVGTGSGVIAISLAAELPHANVDAVDTSDEALSLARENAARLLPDRTIDFKQSDLMLYVTHVYDLIVANLPYVPAGDRGSVSREVLRDPEAAVFGGPAGDEVIRRLIIDAPPKLKPGGLLALELGIGQAEGLSAFLAERGYRDVSARQDYAGVTRFLFARYG
jgi:release factor glutamine methyltransferase